MSNELGKKVREIREAEGRGRQAFSDLTGIPKQTLINIENGRSAPSGKHLELVSKAFSRYALWLVTNLVDESSGHISPEIERARQMLKQTGTDTD
ncbi:helix-turn-helix transcriptional regulator [Halomonas salipaludis]|uniref:Transcriptional regulator n=1 Tax=Halomonas salipaludis TaxID=2032625 RepID=A0A2A2ER38_9GAMM|nr:transcriptional regulator [Halomonas salipaludis]